MINQSNSPQFADLGLPQPLLETIKALGYETPSPIQAKSIPVLLTGRDLLGQAQTGTGKTAAFALPLLSRLNTKDKHSQALILTPTRELAIQVAEACQSYARHLPGFQVVPVYGGAGYNLQLRQLRAGAQLIVGTPGRVMDHLRRGTLNLDKLETLVLDEADEMLRMGFIDDVEWILERTPATRQIALFSATMPREIQRVSEKYLRDPEVVKIESKTTTAASIRQRYWPVAGLHKLDALTRILEVEDFDAAIIFVRTKVATEELAEKLEARGFAAEALHGDMAQAQREKTVEKMRAGRLDILVATDVAARGLDIARISHVINYDIPFDTEAYVHRIGRTGRAGRTGEAILFVSNRERRMLNAIERATGQRIEVMNLPSEGDINTQRIEKFRQRIEETLQNQDLSFYRQLLSDHHEASQLPMVEIAAALAHLLYGRKDFLLKADKVEKKSERTTEKRERRREPEGDQFSSQGKQRKKKESLTDTEARPLKGHPDVAMERFRLAVGYADEVRPGHIVGAIANEAELDSEFIGHIEIFDDFTLVDLPADMPKQVFQHLQTVWVCGRQLRISRLGDNNPQTAPKRPGKGPGKDSGRKPKPHKGGPKPHAAGKKREPKARNFTKK